MGCDIHPAIEYRENDSEPWKAVLFKNKYAGRWESETEYTASLDIGRNYDLFAILGNVRNGSGFAGIRTGSGFDPMSDGRGIPEDISAEARKALSDEHSATYVTLQEILDYDWDRTTEHTGWVNGPQFEHWDRMKEWNAAPSSYCGGISGGRIVHVSETEMRTKVDAIKAELKDYTSTVADQLSNTYCQITWTRGYTETTTQMWTKILPKMLNLGRQYGYGNVRLVMDFDS